MAPPLSIDIWCLILKNFKNDRLTLHSCALVNRVLVTHAVMLLWSDPFDENLSTRQVTALINTLVSCLPNVSKPHLIRYGIILPTTPQPNFNYPSFIKVLKLDQLSRGIARWITRYATVEVNAPFPGDPLLVFCTHLSAEILRVVFVNCFLNKIVIKDSPWISVLQDITPWAYVRCVQRISELHIARVDYNSRITNIIELHNLSYLIKIWASCCHEIRSLYIRVGEDSQLFHDYLPKLVKAQDQLIKVHFSTGNNTLLIDKLLTALQDNTSLEEMEILHTSFTNIFFKILSTCKVLKKLMLIGCKQHDQPFNKNLNSLQIIQFFCKNNFIHPDNLHLIFFAASSTLTTLILDTAPLDVLSMLSPRCRQLRHLVLGINSEPYDSLELLQDLQNLEYLAFCHVSKRFVSSYHQDFYTRLGQSLPIFLQHLHTEYMATPDDVRKFLNGCIAPISILGLNQPCGINRFHLVAACEFVRRRKIPLKKLQYDGGNKEYIIKSSNLSSTLLEFLKEFLIVEVEPLSHPFDADRWPYPRSYDDD